jgi:hypothetical protein
MPNPKLPAYHLSSERITLAREALSARAGEFSTERLTSSTLQKLAELMDGSS